MSEHETDLAMGRTVARTIATVLVTALAVIAAVNFYSDWTKIQIKDRDVVEAKAHADRAMFESMKRAEQHSEPAAK